MNNKKNILLILLTILITNFLTAFIIISVYSSGIFYQVKDMLISDGISSKGTNNIQKYNFVKNLIKSEYVDEVSDDQLVEGSISGLAAAVNDPYTTYLNKSEFESLEIHTQASYAGVGIVVGVDPKDNLIMVSEVIENSPAEKAQIHAGDKLIKVQDTDVNGDVFEKAVDMIRGQKGTNVKLIMYRENVDKPLEFNVTRDSIELKTVRTKMYPNNIGYIRILQFAQKTSEEFENAINSLKNDGAKKLVIDLRDNPGGLLDDVVDLSGQLIPKNLIVYTINKKGEKQEYYCKGNGTDMPFVVLVNERSASASEILSGAIKDYKKGTLIGTKTFGKGLVQSVYKLGDGSGVKITTSKYYTPNGVSINKVGVQPDIVVELKDKDKAVSRLTFEEDLQLQKALEVLN